MTSLEAYILAGMKIAKQNPELTAYEMLRQVLNIIRKNNAAK